MEIPAAIRASVVRRLRALEPADRDTIVLAAAIGVRFELALLAGSAGRSDASTRGALERACDLQLVIADWSPGEVERFAFRHAMTREIVYGDVPAAVVRRLHRDIALALERASLRDCPALASLAHHAGLAGDRARAAFLSELAGDRAASVHAGSDARTWYLRARGFVARGSAAFARLTGKLAALPSGEVC